MKDYCLTCGGGVAFDKAKGAFYCITNRCDIKDMPLLLCPYCQYKCEAALNPNGDGKPSPGSMLLCKECGEWSRFTDMLGLEKIDDINEIEPETFNEMARLSTAVRMTKSNVVVVEVEGEEDFLKFLEEIKRKVNNRF